MGSHLDQTILVEYATFMKLVKKKQIGVCLDPDRSYMYSVADDKRISVTNLTTKKEITSIKCGNLKPNKIALAAELKYLFCTTKEG